MSQKITIDQERRRSLCWIILNGSDLLERMIALKALVDLYTDAGLPTMGKVLKTLGVERARVHAQQILAGNHAHYRSNACSRT